MSVDAKALQLVDRVECVAWKDGAGAVYAVPSSTDPEDFHVVVDAERLGRGPAQRWGPCDCPAGAHGTAVLLRRQRARREPAETGR